MKPHVFIGSSREGLQYAYALQDNLANDGEITVWTQDVFHPSQFTLDSLLKELDLADVGIFVFSPDDVIRSRGVDQAAVRDNVVFEFGLFVGRLGLYRSFIVAPKGEDSRLPSDLLGVNFAIFDAMRTDENLGAALGPASNKIRALLKGVQPKVHRVPSECGIPILELRNRLSHRQRAILSVIEEKGACSTQELATIFSETLMSELIYRLEQLRLLMFIGMDLETAHLLPEQRVYVLTLAYQQELGSSKVPPLGSQAIGVRTKDG
ncbi:putative nucleotide-binding protein with TIR-like domain [Paraburkholderia sp. RAU2J]|uniref:TIR domain-containing protein n=1 Tax=Paraburkholderia sp. RAU2J TaxID=1938810 RepID=UPI000F239AEC|nr:nucleotide-binding protein [Paraburkholderia sp. RAU2J]RKT13283.1 putative nucleotide-binding protein with TIR-like domain [Paraburkholderia sp. RAU2J]